MQDNKAQALSRLADALEVSVDTLPGRAGGRLPPRDLTGKKV